MTDLTKLPRYQCHKQVRAVKIGAISLYDGDNRIRLIPNDGAIPPFVVEEAWHQKHQPVAPGYFVLYDDGYQSWSPVEAFESGYTLIPRDAAGEKYEKSISVPCNLSQTGMMECADYLGPSFSYELRVNPCESAWARHLVRQLGAASEDHPFAPCINVVEYPGYGATEWSLHSLANGRSMGTVGC